MSFSRYRSSRDPEVFQSYQKHMQTLKNEHQGMVPCQLCTNPANRVVDERSTVKVIENLYPYQYFDGRLVAEHLMLIPSRHTNSMDSFSVDEKADFWRVLVKYYENGYTAVTRTAHDSNRTVADHLHTHLFKYKLA